MKKTIAIISNRDLTKSPRIDREIIALKKCYHIHLFGEIKNEDKLNKNVTFYQLYNFRTIIDKVKNRFFLKKSFSKLKRHFKENKISILIIHEPYFLPIAIQLKNEIGIKIIFNAHEYHPLEFEDIPGWLDKKGKEFDGLYKTYLKDIDLFINVSEGIKNKCLTEYGKDSIVIPNASYYNPIAPKLNKGNVIKMIHHGVLLPSREIEKMIETVKRIGPRFKLDIMGLPSSSDMDYYYYLKKITSETKNVSIIDTVPYDEIIPKINTYDVGFYIMTDSSFNHKYALPNKLFEFLQAKLAIVISPLFEMKILVEKYDIGVVSEDFSIESMVKTLNSLNIEKINQYKDNTIKSAKTENAEHYESIFLECLNNLFD